MKRKSIVVVITLILFCFNYINFFSFYDSCSAAPVTLYVGEEEQYTSINAAIENASAGYRIFVYNGTYYENLIIDKKIDLFGEDRSITTIDGNNNGDVIVINASNVNISHFTVKNGGSTDKNSIIRINYGNSIITDNIISNGFNGIFINNSNGHFIYDNIIRFNTGDGIQLNQSDNNINISYNAITSNNNGIYLYSSDGNKIYNNDIKNNYANGIFLNKTCNTNKLVNNNVSDNDDSGIYLNDFSNYSIISNNKIYINANTGLVLENCSFNTINKDNKISGNTNYGLMVIGSNNVIQSNSFSSNKKDGIYLTADDNNTISSNILCYNTLAGIRLYNSTDDYIYNNEIFNNTAYGAYLDFFTLRNLVCNNYFSGNGQNAVDKSLSRNSWNMTKTSATNIVDGPYKSGNFWDDFDEKSEGALDVDGDGIADTSYTIYASVKDNGPLIDVTSPTIWGITTSPASQALGGYTNISATITDNIEVKNVYLFVTDPNSQSSNISITQNKTGNKFYCYKQFSPVGAYSFTISAVDSRNWVISSSKQFNISSGQAPRITDNTPTTGSPSSTFVFNATVIDDEDIASELSVYVIWNHGSLSANETMINVGGNYFQRLITLDKSIDSLTYHLYAIDQWGNTDSSGSKTVSITDTQPPQIEIVSYGSSFDDLPNSFTFEAKVTDASIISNVYIEYWYGNSNNKTSLMNNNTIKGESYYKKVILPDGIPEIIFCVIYATDIFNNQNNTKNPFAKPGGPYSGFILGDILFDGSESFDLDGTITNYSWDFGDGTNGFGSSTKHTYNSDGNYLLTLTVTDDEGRTGVNKTTVNISKIIPYKIPTDKLAFLNDTFNLELEKQFYCYDTSGTGNFDTFHDPNNQLFSVHTGNVNISGNICFLLSIGDDDVPEFFWNTSTDEIISISHKLGVVQNLILDEDEEQVTCDVIVDKVNWIYFEIDDEYPYANLLVTANSRVISPDFIWRKNNKIYVFDDPETTYHFVFNNIYPYVETPTFSPADGGLINEDNPTITITYNVPVRIASAVFGPNEVTAKIDTSNDLVFTYTPSSYLENGTYLFEIDAQALQGNSSISSGVVYFYFAYTNPPVVGFIESYWMWILLCIILIILVVMFVLLKYQKISLDDFIYVKNRKIIPFFKTIIFGPLSVNVDNNEISKAEFYVDGQLKESLNSPPFFWKWKERAFLKHTLETKVYDDEGNFASSGEKTFYIFNPINRAR